MSRAIYGRVIGDDDDDNNNNNNHFASVNKLTGF